MLRRIGRLLPQNEPARGAQLENVFERVGRDGNAAGSRLAQVVFADDAAEIPLEDLPCDIALRWRSSETGPHATLYYDAAVFDESTAQRLIGHLETLLGSALADPNRCVSSLPLLTADERRELLVEWNATMAPFPERCLHELISEQASMTPGSVAVECEAGVLTYGELDRRSNQLAQHLRSLGVGPETYVALAIERAPDLFVALLATLKAGGAYVPLDPAYPAERLAFMLADSRAPVVLTTSELAQRFRFAAEHVLCMDRDAAALDGESGARAHAAACNPQQLAYVIYTSGSTGRPKGVQIPHRGAG